MPTSKPRVSWILDPDVIRGIQTAADENDRPIAMQANRVLRTWLKDEGYLKLTDY